MRNKLPASNRPKKPSAPVFDPENLAVAELDARRAQRLQTVEALKSARTPLTVIDVAKRSTALAEKAIEDFMATDSPPTFACKEGCDWCCQQTVGTTAPEVLRVVDYLRGTLSAHDLDATCKRIAELNELQKLPFNQRTATRIPALLVEHRCVAYPVRPLTCRGFNSSDAHQRAVPRRTAATRVPNYVPQLRLATFCARRDAPAVAIGIERRPPELTAALHIAFTVPNAAERWLAGEAVFAPRGSKINS